MMVLPFWREACGRITMTGSADLCLGSPLTAHYVKWSHQMDNLQYVEVASYPTSFEASLARNHLQNEGIPSFLAGEAIASWFWQYGPAIKGVRLMVEIQQAQEARRLLSELIEENAKYDDEESELWNSDGEQTQELPPDLVRAWRAAVMSLGVCPVLLNVYSTWLLLKNNFFVDHAGGKNWRVPVAVSINTFVFGMLAWVCYGIFAGGPTYSHSRPIDSIPTIPSGLDDD